MKKETVICAMLATATCATAQNGKFPTSGVSADSIQTEKDSIKADKETEIYADKEAEIQAVTITGHRPMYKMRNDVLVTRVRNTPLAKEPTLEDVLRHIPGMKQTADGTLEVNGLGAPIRFYVSGTANQVLHPFADIDRTAVWLQLHLDLLFYPADSCLPWHIPLHSLQSVEDCIQFPAVRGGSDKILLP